MQRRVLPLLAALAFGAAACSTSDPGVSATQAELFTPVEITDYPVISGVVDFGSEKTPQPYDGFLTAAFEDIESFWADHYPDVYGDGWRPLQGGIYAAYPDRTEPIPGCGQESSSYQDVADGGAFYCSDGDFMAYDDAGLLPNLVDELGQEAVAIVLAHEFGHAVQFRADAFDQPTVMLEQQADCFAGAWAAHVASGASDVISFDDTDIRAGLLAMLNFRDPPQAGGLANAGAHGTGFDRVGAFQDGFNGGVERCAQFPDEDRQLVDLPFDPGGGNLPLEDPTGQGGDIVTLLPKSLDEFWGATADDAGVDFTTPALESFDSDGPFPPCDGLTDDDFRNQVRYCASDNTVHFDQSLAERLAASKLTGDLSVGYLLAVAYADSWLVATDSDLTGEPRALRLDCLAGAYVGSFLGPVTEDQTIYLSAGDLDEAIGMAIARSDQHTDTDVNGSAFEKVDAFRTGVLDGLDACSG